MKKILSIDGGGIRGILPGQVLVSLEKKLQKKSGNANARLTDYFDLFAGTSTGGILTGLYLCPDNNGKPKYSASDAVELYSQHGGSIFKKKRFTLDGLIEETYDASELETLLKGYLGDVTLDKLVKNCMITAYDIADRRATFFTNFPNTPATENYKLRDVCRATSAAPTYFEPANITSLGGVTSTFVDGGVFANNPSLCAYSEIRTQFPDLTAKDMIIVSLGTGTVKTTYSFDETKNWGKVKWIQPIIDIMMGGSSEVTEFHMQKMFEAVKMVNASTHQQYFRIAPASLDPKHSDMDDASAGNINYLMDLGAKTAQDNDSQLEAIADMLIEEKKKETIVLA
jgi:patatin-like phospholipase/acyl hydrolase